MRRRQRPPLQMRILAPIVLGIVVLAAWQFTVTAGAVPRSLLPAPMEVAERLTSDLAGPLLLRSTFTTMWEAVLGCLLAAVIAMPTGYLIARSTLLEAAVSPYLAASQAIPAVAIAPLLVIWVGYGLTPIVLLCTLLVFFPILLGTVLGLRHINPDLIKAAQLDGAHGPSMVTHIEWPLARRTILTGVRNGFTLSITGAVVGEMVMGGRGLGLVLSVQASNADTTGLFATLIVLCALAVVIYLGLLAIEIFADPERT